MAAKNNQNDKL